MEQKIHNWTIWSVTEDEGSYRVRVGCVGGPPGNVSIVKIKEKRFQLLLDIFNVKKEKDMQQKTFKSYERNGSAALYDLFLSALQY